jgi:arginyl-tRNA synthetase
VKARTEFEESEALYGGQLGAASQQDRYRQLYPMIKKQRRLQPQLMSLLEKAIDAGKEERTAAVDQLNVKFDEYNTGVMELSKQVDLIIDQLETQP